MATLLAARRGDTTPIEGVSDPEDPDHAVYESGALLPGPGATLAGPTFVEWLDAAACRSGGPDERVAWDLDVQACSAARWAVDRERPVERGDAVAKPA
jgi:hypothetical protein